MRISIATAVGAVMLLVALHLGGCEHRGTSLEELLPRSDEIAGWARDGEMQLYGPDGLWEYIDGAAENFLAYGFEEVVVQDYRGDGRRLKVEIYRLGSPLMAFGIYSQFRGPGLRFLSIGTEAFADPYSLHFWKDRYLVKIAVFEESDDLSAAMERFAAAVAAKIPGGAAFPEEIRAFPENGLVDKSVTYVAEGALGSEGFPPSFVADYRYGEVTGKLYLSLLASEEEAREIFNTFSDRFGAGETEPGSPPGKVVIAKAEDRYRGEMVLFLCGRWFGVLTGFAGAEGDRDRLAAAAVERIGRYDAAPAR
jgi:hypothetical protein